MTDLISRADAIKAKPEYRNEDMLDKEKSTYNKGWNDCNDAWVAIIKALPSADAVSREDYEKIKNMVSTQFQTVLEDYLELEKRYVALLGKQSQKPSAEAEPSLKAIKRQIDEHWYLGAPSAEAVQGWIPCSERLPKKGEVVLITNGKGNVRCGQYRSEHDVRGGTHYWWWKGKTVESVLAWMPLPTPYKGGDSE